MDTPFFKEIKPYNRGGNNTENAKRTDHFMIEFICKAISLKMTNTEYNELTHGVC